MDGAIVQYREAIRLDPKFAWPHNDLGVARYNKGDLDGAIVEYREAIRLNPQLAIPHSNLGDALNNKGDLDGAIVEYVEAIRLDPHYPAALANLPRVRRMRELLSRLPLVLGGKEKPKTSDEGCEFAFLCGQPFQRRYADAVRLYAEAFAADPKLAEDVKSEHRYDAACCAARAGCGKGEDADKLNDKDRKRLRSQAQEWLRADLVRLRRQAGSTEAAPRQETATKMAHWLMDSDLAGVRPGPNQIAMPAVERAAWDALWADVKATLADAQKPAPPAGKDAGKK